MKFFIILFLGLLVHAQAEDQLLKDFSTGYNRFTAGVYKELLKSNSGSFLVCPLSVDIILALVNCGAKGQTANEITATLHLPESTEKVKELFTKIASNLKGNDKYQLSSANKVYLKPGFKISKTFRDAALNTFGAELENIDFEKRGEASSEINKWAEVKTNDKIKNLIKPEYLNRYTRSVLVNAIYFHGNWARPFPEEVTEKKPFYLNDKDSIEVATMFTVDEFDYYESPELDAKFLRLPYEGGDVSVNIVLPNHKNGLAALEANIENVLVPPKYTNEFVHVQIPKGKIESTIEFVPILEALGIKAAFNDKEADFSGIAVSKEDLVISKVIQKTFIEVDEKGTTAAAVTAVVVAVPESAAGYVMPPKVFRADHPFLFYVCLEKLGLNLFVGTYKSPTE